MDDYSQRVVVTGSMTRQKSLTSSQSWDWYTFYVVDKDVKAGLSAHSASLQITLI